MDQIKVGRFLAELRRTRGLSQKELGEEIGATDKTVSRWERGANLPDIETLLALSRFYGVNINELLCGERLSEGELPEKSAENISYVARAEKNKLKTAITASAIALIGTIMIFLLAFSITFITSRRNMLYPVGISDAQTQKEYKGNIEILSAASGEVIYTDSESGISFSLALPEGYVEKQGGLYTNGESFVSVKAYDEVDYPYPLNLAISQYFSSHSIGRYVDRVRFAYMNNIEDVGLFDSENSIEIAAGCRIIRSFSSIANTEGQIGDFYYFTGDYRGYITSACPSDEENNVWSICLESDTALCFITVKDKSIKSVNDLSLFISSINFIN